MRAAWLPRQQSFRSNHTTMAKCPKCNRDFSNPGLHGHLRFSHGLEGEELEQAFDEATKEPTEEPKGHLSKQDEQPNGSPKEAQSTQENGKGARPASGPSTPQRGGSQPDERDRLGRDPLRRRLEKLRKARERRRAVEEVMETSSNSRSFLPSSSKKERPANRTWQELLEECAEEEKNCEEALRSEVRVHEAARA